MSEKDNIKELEFTPFFLLGAGFELVKQYDHDQYNTSRYKLGVLEVEFTYENGKHITTELHIEETNCKYVSLEDIKALHRIFHESNVY